MNSADEKNMAYSKWSQPGWRVEQKYANRVLIGNWAEERLQFTRDCKTANSTNRLDFRPQMDHRPDVLVRRTALRRAEGLPSRFILTHHDTPSSHYLVTLYDESYGRRGASAHPACRSWQSDKMGWVPERSDHPVQGPPTNYGLAERRRARVGELQEPVPTQSVYKAAYPLHPTSAFCQPRHAKVPRLVTGTIKGLDVKLRTGTAGTAAATPLPPLTLRKLLHPCEVKSGATLEPENT